MLRPPQRRQFLLREATGTGVPQVALPLWYDIHDFAARVEYLGIRFRGNKRSAPRVDDYELGTASMMIVDGGVEENVTGT